MDWHKPCEKLGMAAYVYNLSTVQEREEVSRSCLAIQASQLVSSRLISDHVLKQEVGSG